jgi:AcrR family transcriptional regulator
MRNVDKAFGAIVRARVSEVAQSRIVGARPNPKIGRPRPVGVTVWFMAEDAAITTRSARLTACGAQTRSRIVATAAELMRVRSFGGTTLDDVAEANSVGKSQLYRRFVDKPALVRSLVEFVGDRAITGQRERLGKALFTAWSELFEDVPRRFQHNGTVPLLSSTDTADGTRRNS